MTRFQGGPSVTSDAPQGSVTGPGLFLVYVNDMMEGIDAGVSLFTGEVNLVLRIQKDEVQVGLLRDLDRLQAWSND